MTQHDYITNTDGSWMTFDQIVSHLLIDLSDNEKDLLANMPEDDLIKFHHGFGTWIRNIFGLWAGATPLGSKHPDDYCMEIIEELWRQVQTISPSKISAGITIT